MSSTLRRDKARINSDTDRDLPKVANAGEVGLYYQDNIEEKGEQESQSQEQVRCSVRVPVGNDGAFGQVDERPSSRMESPTNKIDNTGSDTNATPQQDLDYIKQKLIKYNFDLLEGHPQQSQRIKAADLGNQLYVNRPSTRDMAIAPPK